MPGKVFDWFEYMSSPNKLLKRWWTLGFIVNENRVDGDEYQISARSSAKCTIAMTAPSTSQSFRSENAVRSVDVAIVGGGVAGSAAALTLRRYTSLSVAVFERSSYQRARPGEHISVESAPLLDYLGVDDDALLRGHVAGGIPVSAWDAAELREERTAFRGAARAWFLDRALFDRTLAAEAQRCGAVFRCDGSVRSATLDDAACRWDLHVDGPRGGERWRARGLVDAGGSSAPIARRLGSSFLIDDALYAVVGRVRGAAPRLRNLVVEASPDGWWYAVRSGRRSRRRVSHRPGDNAPGESHAARSLGRCSRGPATSHGS